MAITMRYGVFEDLDPNKMLPAEWGIVMSGDPVVADGKSVFICFAAGDVKRMATYEDMVRQFGDMAGDTIIQLTEGVNTCITNAQAATGYANRAGNNADSKAQSAEAAANAATAAAENIDKLLANGELTGPQGPQGEKGSDGAVTTFKGQYALQVKPDGHLYLIYPDGDTPPDMHINEDGHLILRIGGE